MRYSTCKYAATLKPRLEVTEVIENDTIRSGTYDLLLTFHSNHSSLSRTVSEINGDFRQKSPIFPTPVYLTPPAEGFLLELGIGAICQKAPMMGRWSKKFKDRFSILDAIPGLTDRRTDRHVAVAKTALCSCRAVIIRTSFITGCAVAQHSYNGVSFLWEKWKL